jgi:alpha-tubulin suppressor-like RCC1 family protein
MGTRRFRGRRAALSAILAAGGWVLLPLSGCDYLLGYHGSPPQSACVLGEKRCTGSVTEICTGVGEWTTETACASPSPVCFEGSCVAMEQVSCGGRSTCVLLSDGSVLCWGSGGQACASAGQGGAPSQQKVELPGPASEISTARDDSGRACALLDDGTVWCWGGDPGSEPGPGCAATIPASAVALPQGKIAHVRAGPGRTCVVTDQGELWCWGQNASGETLPLGKATIDQPARVDVGESVTDVAFGVAHTCALANHKVFCWGKNDVSQCGAPADPETHLPREVPEAAGATSLAAGDHHTCAVAGGAVVCWGEGSCGQLGTVKCGDDCADNGPSRAGMCGETPVVIPGAGGAGDAQILAGAQHTCLWRPGGGLSCWGHDRYWQVLPAAVVTPYVLKKDFLIADRLADVSIGAYHGCGIREDGEIWCWGRNNHEQLGRADKAGAGDESHEAPGSVHVQSH